MADLPLQLPAVPEGFCNSLNDANWVQTLINLIAQGVAVLDGSGFSVVLNQATAPGPTDRDKLWRDTDTGRIYEFSGGAWVTPNPEPPSGDVRRWWAGTLADLITYDGGAAGAVGTNSGPMWEEDTDMVGRSPMHPGAIPTSNPAKTLSVGENYGEGAHQMTQAELPATLSVPRQQAPNAGDPYLQHDNNDQGDQGVNRDLTLNYDGGGATMPVIHPVRGLYVIKRTARVNYVGS